MAKCLAGISDYKLHFRQRGIIPLEVVRLWTLRMCAGAELREMDSFNLFCVRALSSRAAGREERPGVHAGQ